MGRLTEDMKRVLREQRLGYVATVRPDGTPNLSPKATTTVWDDDHLIFADLRSPGTVENLHHNPDGGQRGRPVPPQGVPVPGQGRGAY
jgi:predicted pyridoxine 5'-phosphate oxidase superfamily flavin-nucleotide-binding protein